MIMEKDSRTQHNGLDGGGGRCLFTKQIPWPHLLESPIQVAMGIWHLIF